LVYPSAHLLKAVRRAGVQRMPLCRSVLQNVGVFPIRSHYYEPQFHFDAARPLSDKRTLGGVDWNVPGQLALLDEMKLASELNDFGAETGDPLQYRFGNGMFESGDAEYWYQLIRLKKPRRIFEVGCGNSTLVAARALARNRAEDASYACEHVCIEPYEMPWLDRLGIRVMRERVETLDVSFFQALEAGDILFIDSSHVIRPQGDVVFEYLELLPSLRPGVMVHVHDVFSPRDYLKQWVVDEVRLWNEQYLLEAFLSHNSSWEVIGALNYLHHDHAEPFRTVAPYVTADREPCSFYLQKVA
ncbi:MAG: class I SAM-dependent methyltransferase, partial [Steroidobacteraceae bacterium]